MTGRAVTPHFWRSLLLILLCQALPLHAATQATADHGVILVYHHVATDTPAVTSVTPTTFRAHLDYLQAHGFVPTSLRQMVADLAAGRRIANNAVAITFDDAYASVYHQAYPMLAKRQWPFSVFVSTSAITDNPSTYVTWAQLAEMADNGAEIENHSHTHDHLAFPPAGESRDAWTRRVQDDISTASRLIQQHIGRPARLFAYPYGEFSPALQQLVSSQQLTGMGQHSGAAGFHSNFASLPRHPVHSGADSLAYLGERLRTRPLRVTVSPAAADQPIGRDHIDLTLAFEPDAYQRNTLACFLQGKPVWSAAESAADSPLVANLSALGPLQTGRSKLNCTARANDEPAYFWWSYLLQR